MLENIILFAQDTTRYNHGLSYFQWGLTGVGVSIIGLGAILFFAKPKEGASQSSPATRLIALIVCLAIGLGVIGYGWLGFETR